LYHNEEEMRRSTWLLLIPVLLLMTWMGGRGLNADAIWYDEWWSFYMAGGAHYGPISFDEFMGRAETDPWHPPAYYVLLSGWGALVGWTPYAARALSLWAGVLAVAWTYRLGREMQSMTVGLAAAVALASSAFFGHYLHEIRDYSLYTMLTVFTLWAYWRMISTRAGLGMQTAFFVGAVLLIYTHYFAALGLAAVAIYHVLFERKTRGWWRPPVITGLAGLLFLPWLRVLLAAVGFVAEDVARQASSLTPGEVVSRLLFMFSNGNTVLLIVAGVYAARKPTRALCLLWFWLFAVLILAVILNAWLGLLTEMRYLILLWPVVAILFGAGLARWVASRGMLALILVVWALVGVWSAINASPLMVAFNSPSSDTYNNSLGNAFRTLPWDTLRETIRQRGQPGDVLALHRPDAVWAVQGVFDYYLHDTPVRPVIMETLSGGETGDEYFRSAQQFIDDAPRVWLAVDKTIPPNFRLGVFQESLAQGYASCGTVFNLPNMKLDLFVRVPPENNGAMLTFGEGTGVDLLEPLPEMAEGELQVLLGWSIAPEVPPNTYSVGLHIENAQGQLVGQLDNRLPGTGFTCQPVTLSLANFPPGEYRLLMMVYDWASGERLDGHHAGTGEDGDRLMLGAFRIE
jgi:hypothetical protein